MLKVPALFSFIIVLFVIIMLSLFPSWGIKGIKRELASNKENTQPEKDKYTYIGETVTNSKGVEFTVLSVDNTTNIGYFSTTNNFVIVHTKIYNGSSEPYSRNSYNFTLLSGFAKYEHHSATFDLSDYDPLLNEINPGITRTVSVAFETPSTTLEQHYMIQFNENSFYENGVKVILTHRSDT